MLKSGEGLPPPCPLWSGKERQYAAFCPKATGAQCDYRPSILEVNDLGGQEERGLQGRKQREDWTHLKDRTRMGREEPNPLTPQSPWSLSAGIRLSGEAWRFLRQAPALTLSLVLVQNGTGHPVRIRSPLCAAPPEGWGGLPSLPGGPPKPPPSSLPNISNK